MTQPITPHPGKEVTIYIDKTSIEGDRDTIRGEGNITYSKDYNVVTIDT